MTAQFPFLRASMAPTALAAAIALSFAFAAPAQAQYHYPGSASSSGAHMANAIHPIRARGDNRADYGNGASPSNRNRTHNRNPSMQPGEACPIGSACGPHAPSGAGSSHGTGYGSGAVYGQPSAPHQANAIHPIPAQRENPAVYGHSSNPLRNRNPNPSMQPNEACPIGSPCGPHAPSGASSTGSAGYGRGVGYGQASAPRQANSVHPIRAQAVDQKELLPARTGGVNPALGVTRNNVGNKVPTTSYEQSAYQKGQIGLPGQTSYTNGHGQKVTLGGPQTVTAPNGQKINFGGAQTPSDAANSHSIDGEQFGGQTHAPGMPAPGGFNGPDQSANADGDRSNPNFKSGQQGANANYDGLGHTIVGHTDNGIDSNGTQWRNGMVWDGTDDKGTQWVDGQWKGGGTVPTTDDKAPRQALIDQDNDASKDGKKSFLESLFGESGGVGDDPDIGPQRGSPEGLMGANGKRKSPGKRPGDDAPGGANPDGTDSTSSHNGKNVGTNTYVKATNKNGQDIPVKPKDVGVLNASKLQNGAIDPKRDRAVTTGGNGGG